MNPNIGWKWLYRLFDVIYFLSGLIEVLLLIVLSIVGEREDGSRNVLITFSAN